MWIRGSREMPVAPNQLLLNGKVLLTKSHCSVSNPHSHHIYQYGFPFPILPNLNSLPEKMASTGMSEGMCSPSTPVTLDKNKRIQDRLPREVIDLVDKSVIDKNIQGMENGLLQPTAEELAGLFFSKQVMSSQVVSSQQQEGNKNIVMPSDGVSLQGEHGKRENQDIDLNRTPQQKPRRKKHRPKVIREGKPAKTPKPVTPKPVTPKQARNKESPSGKRKYVRKKKVLNSSDTLSCPLRENVDQDSGSGTKSVRRCLNFDSEKPQARYGCLGSSLIFAHNAESEAHDACISGTITSLSTKSVVPSAQGREVVVENSPARITFDLNSSTNQIPNEYIRIPKTPTPSSQPSRRETMRINPILNGYIEMAKNPPPPPQPSRREIIRENLMKFAWQNDYLKIADNSDRLLETSKKSQLDSNNTSDVLLRGAKRDHNLVDEDHVSTHINFMHAYNGIDCISESHDMSRHGPYFPESCKKKRTEKGQNELTSNASSSVTCTPSGSWNTSLVVPNNCEVFTFADAQKPVASSWKMSLAAPNNCEVFTFADAQRLMSLEKLRASERMLSFDQGDKKTKKVPKVSLQANNLTSPSVTKDCNNFPTPVKPSGFNNTDRSQLSTPEKARGCNDSQESEICGPQTCTEALVVNNHVKKKTKRCIMREQIHFVKPISSNTNQMFLQEDEAASCSYGSSYGQKSVQVTASASGNFKDKNSHLRVTSLQDYHSSSNFKESLSGAIVPHGDPVDDILRKLKCLNINGGHEIVTDVAQNALVPYSGGGGMVVPYEAPFDLSKKRRPRAKVDLDPETNRVWNLLMGKESGDEKMDMDKEKWWEDERRIFRGRVDSFIARMHLVQGDRRFSQWKGSVVDSVVGVFLTQNVSDHLSSSAYMALAARFPLRSNGDNSQPNAEKVSKSSEHQESCIIAIDDSIKCQEMVLGQDLCFRGSLLIPEAEHMAEKEMANSNEALGSNIGGSVVDYSKGKDVDVHERELEIGHGSPDSRTGTQVTVTGSTSVAEAEDRRSMEDVVSSQNSAVSSQNSSEYLVQTDDQIQMSSLSNFDAEDLIYGGICNGLDSSTSFLELLQMAETIRFQELYSHANGRISSTEYCGAVDQLACLEVDKRIHASDQFDNLNGECLSMYKSNSLPHDTQHDFTGVPCAPSLSYNLYKSSNSRLTSIGDIKAAREESSSRLLSTASGLKSLNTTNSIKRMGRRCGPLTENSTEAMGRHDFMGASCAPSPSYDLHNSSSSTLTAMGNVNAIREENSSHLPSTASGMNITNNNKIMGSRCGPSAENLTEAMCQHDFTGVSCAAFPSSHLHNFSNSRLMVNVDVNAVEENRSHLPSTASGMNRTNNIKIMGRRCGPLAENSTEATSKTAPEHDIHPPLSKHSVQPLAFSETEVCVDKHSFCYGNLPREKTEALSSRNTLHKCSHLQDNQTAKFQQKETGVEFQVKSTEQVVISQAQMQSGRILQTCLNSHNNSRETLEVVEAVESNLKDEAYSSQKVSAATADSASKTKKVKPETEKKKTYDWDNLRKQACLNGAKKERSSNTMDSLDWEAIRCADVNEISQTIRERGMNNMLAARIKEFLNRVVKDHGSIDLEWLRDVPPDAAKDYLLSIRGLGLKSVECVRLLTLHHLAFPVDTNVGRICVRLGWVPLQPLPESLQLHLLEMYPILETIQKYLWPRLCKLDQRTLYELHYQMITFGKVFCTKSKPNCNACPMRGECKHFASAFASARLALPGPEEKGLVSSTIPIASETGHTLVFNPMPLPLLKGSTFSQEGNVLNNCEPIIEEPATPEPELIGTLESEIEDAFYEDPDEIPTIKLNLEKFTQNVQNYMQENNMELQDGDLSKALVAITSDAASIPMPKLKNVSRLRTEHQVYELPDSHPLLEGLDQREPDDPCSYLLAIWSPGETAQSTEPPKICCNSQDMGKLCDQKTCFGCNSIREAQAQTVRGTILMPCRTAMRGSFPLNGTYFQVNEVFADHDSSCNPINVPREWIWNLPRRTVYFGTSIPTIFKGLTTEGIQHCFWRGFVCVRGFDRTTRAPKPLYARLHFPASKAPRNRRGAAAAAAAAAAARED